MNRIANVAFLLLLFAPTVLPTDNHVDGYEPEIIDILNKVQAGQLEEAMTVADAHVQRYPKSRVGHLLRADILQAMVHNPLAFSPTPGHQPEALRNASEVAAGLRKQILYRWQHQIHDQETAHKLVPASLIDIGRHDYALVSDMQSGRLYLYRNQNGDPQLVHDYYMSVGSAGFGKQIEGDNKTPIGVYSIYQHIDGEELPDLYGGGAYPVDYPNRYDRALKRTGYGIWLHGTPSNTYARKPWASEGCFVLSNEDLLDIEQFIDVESRTPVVLADTIEWVTLEALRKRRQQLRLTIENWRRDWENLDTEAYLSHYSRDYFNFGTEDFERWATRKKQVNTAKTFVQIDMDIDSLFLYPGAKDMFVVRYTQYYLSNNYAGKINKEQYWQRDDSGRWRIIYES